MAIAAIPCCWFRVAAKWQYIARIAALFCIQPCFSSLSSHSISIFLSFASLSIQIVAGQPKTFFPPYYLSNSSHAFEQSTSRNFTFSSTIHSHPRTCLAGYWPIPRRIFRRTLSVPGMRMLSWSCSSCGQARSGLWRWSGSPAPLPTAGEAPTELRKSDFPEWLGHSFVLLRGQWLRCIWWCRDSQVVHGRSGGWLGLEERIMGVYGSQFITGHGNSLCRNVRPRASYNLHETSPNAFHFFKFAKMMISIFSFPVHSSKWLFLFQKFKNSGLLLLYTYIMSTSKFFVGLLSSRESPNQYTLRFQRTIGRLISV